MEFDEIQAVVKMVSYPDHTLIVQKDGRGEMYLRAFYDERDIITGQIERQYTRRWFLSPEMVKSEIVQTAFKCIITSAEHRVREHFTYRGERIFSPHYDVDALVELCKAKAFDYRRRKPQGRNPHAWDEDGGS